MNYYDPDTLRLLTRERHEQRLREANAERIARELRGRNQKRHLPHLNMHLSLHPSQHGHQPHLRT